MDFLDTVNDKAQDAFRRCLASFFQTGSWVPGDVDEYLNTERDLDWERQKAEFDRLQAADHDMHYFPDPTCDDCQEENAAMWERMGRAV
jgi:hypothetical protein